MKRNLDKEICRENERMKFYSLYFDISNINRRRLFISVLKNSNLHVISLFKATSFLLQR